MILLYYYCSFFYLKHYRLRGRWDEGSEGSEQRLIIFLIVGSENEKRESSECGIIAKLVTGFQCFLFPRHAILRVTC